jgi:hypothetical protein
MTGEESGIGTAPVPLPAARTTAAVPALWPAALLLTATALLLRFFTMPTGVDSLDAVFFVRGLTRYSVLEARPHWPGYPVYMAVGRLVALVGADAEASLRIVSVLASSLSVWPLMAVVHGWRRGTGGAPPAGRRAAVVAGLLWVLSPLSWLVGTQIGSEPLALLVALTVLWLSSRSVAGSSPDSLPLAGGLAGLLLGIRLPYGSLLLPLFEAVRRRLTTPDGPLARRALVWCAVAAALPVAAWLGWQVSMDGGAFFAMADLRLRAHYGNWTERVLAHGHWFSRPAGLARVLAVDGLGGWWPGLPLGRLPATVGWAALIVTGGGRLLASPVARQMLAFWTIPYLLMILLFNDVGLSRYALPLVAGVCMLGGMASPERPLPAYGIAAAMAFALAAVTLPLAREHRRAPLLAVQWVRYLAQLQPPERAAVVVTDDVPLVSLVIEEYAPAHRHALVSRPEMPALVAAYEAEGRRVYSTSPDPTAPHEWIPLACFARNPLLQSRGPWELWLYEHGGEPSARRPVCRNGGG